MRSTLVILTVASYLIGSAFAKQECEPHYTPYCCQTFFYTEPDGIHCEGGLDKVSPEECLEAGRGFICCVRDEEALVVDGPTETPYYCWSLAPNREDDVVVQELRV